MTILSVLLGVASAQLPSTPPVVVQDDREEAKKLAVTPAQKLDPRSSVAQVLARAPGVQVFDRDNLAQDLKLTVRGFGARSNFGIRSTRLLIDGVPADTPDGQGQLGTVDVRQLQAVELETGPFSARSAGSAGGVMVFRPQPQKETGLGTTVGLGSFDQVLLGLQLSDRLGTMPVQLSHTRITRSGERAQSSGERINSAFNALGALGENYQWSLRGQRFELANALDPQSLSAAELRTNPRGVNAAVIEFAPRKDVRQGQLALQLLGAGQRPTVAAYWAERDVEQFLSIPEQVQRAPQHPGGVIDFARVSLGLSVEYPLWGGLIGMATDRLDEDRFGYQNFRLNQRGVRGELKRDERNQVIRDAVYGEWQFAPLQHWSLAAGARAERLRYSSEDRFIRPGNLDDSFALNLSQFSPFLRIERDLAAGTQLYARVGSGFEAPTLGELAYAPDGDGFNRTLLPSISRHAELGVRARLNERVRVQAALFGSRSRDEIVTARNQGGRSAFQNAGRVRRQGVEIGGRARVNRQLDLDFNFTALSARYRDSFAVCVRAPCASANVLVRAGARLPGVSERVSQFGLGYRIGHGWRARLQLQTASNLLASDLGSPIVPGHWVAGAGVQKRFRLNNGAVTVDARIDNLANRRYVNSVVLNEANERYFEPAPGRTFGVTVAVDF